MYKAVISRITAEGESAQVEVHAKTEPELQSKLVAAGKAVDARLYEQNLRIVAVHNRMQALPHEARLAVHEIFQLLLGKRMPRPSEISMQIASGMDTPDSAIDEVDAKNGGNPYSPHPGVDSIDRAVQGQVA